MTAITILLISCILGAFAQNPHSIPGFHYTGCSCIDISCFGNPITLPNGVTPEACQKACDGFQFAALLNEECRCGNDPKAISPKDESMCDHACQNNAQLGCCGNSSPQENPDVANVYAVEPQLQQYSKASTAATTDASQSLSPAAPVSSQLGASGSLAPYPQSQSSVLATTMPAPVESNGPCSPAQLSKPADGSSETGESSVAGAVGGSSSADGSLTAYGNPTADGSQTVYGNPTADGSQTVYETPSASGSQTALGYPTAEGQAPEPKSFESSGVDGAYATAGQPTSAPAAPQYETTMATMAAPSNQANGMSPAPSQLPGSDSSPVLLPSFSSIGSFFMIAFMMM